jgi:hypothetical protein
MSLSWLIKIRKIIGRRTEKQNTKLSVFACDMPIPYSEGIHRNLLLNCHTKNQLSDGSQP